MTALCDFSDAENTPAAVNRPVQLESVWRAKFPFPHKQHAAVHPAGEAVTKQLADPVLIP